MKKRSFFERLSGSSSLDDEYDTFDDDVAPTAQGPRRTIQVGNPGSTSARAPVQDPDQPTGGHLPVDMYQTPNEIIIRAFVAGVRPDDMNVSITRDMVTIEGSREARTESSGADFFHQELFWGSFARTIMLPQEIDVDTAAAAAKDGLITLTLPKLDKSRQTKLKVRAN